MASDSLSQRKAQLDKEEREHLEDIVTEMRGRVEDNVEFQLTQKGLDDEPEDVDSLDEETQQLVEAIELEAVDGETWSEAFDQYVTGVGYTIVNRLAALRCMEVRGFIDEEVTVFKENGLTPAAETLVHDEFLLEDEAILEAYHNACDYFAEEIEILFDRSSAYSLIDPDDDTFEELCEMLDEVPDQVWQADDVLGWIYEYYNTSELSRLREKARTTGLEPEDIAAANQFYTPHWVVRLLTDNSLGKLYLESQGSLQQTIASQRDLTTSERKSRSAAIEDSPEIADLCTYLVPGAEGTAPEFNEPAELRVIDPACGSGHFLLYAFDILERIWRAECPDLDPSKIPRKILKHNLYGVDLDLRACQLTAFNLYLKARSRAEEEGTDDFKMPSLSVVCADAKVIEFGAIEEIFDEIAGQRSEIRSSLQTILDAFEDVQGLGSLLDVRGTLEDHFDDGTQLTLTDSFHEDQSLSSFLHSLQEEIDERQDSESFLAKDLRSFVKLIDILTEDYHVSLMNPPYGNRQRMPSEFKDYIDEHYQYYADFYVSFFEVCSQITLQNGRIGMLVPWTILFKRSFEGVRENFVGEKGAVDFLAEFRYGILDNATVGTIGTVVRNGTDQHTEGTFLRLHDIEKGEKERVFLDLLSGEYSSEIKRWFTVPMIEFSRVPATPINYSIPSEIRELHNTELKLGPNAADIEGQKVTDIKTGLQTGNNARFVRNHWETFLDEFEPYAKGGEQSWITPRMTKVADWRKEGNVLERTPGSLLRNRDYYHKSGLTWTYIKRTGRRFGYIPGGLFDVAGSMLFPNREISPWLMMGVLNSTIYHGLFLSLTPERHWQIEIVGRIPWHAELESQDRIEKLTKEQFDLVVKEQTRDPQSPYYTGPAILPDQHRKEQFYQHPYSASIPDEVSVEVVESTQSILEAAKTAERKHRKRRQRLESLSDDIDEIVANVLELSDQTLEDIRTEIFLRTAESPEDREVPSPNEVNDDEIEIDKRVEELIHYVTLKAVRESSDGIIPLTGSNGDVDLLEAVIQQFREIYGQHSESRLAEIDDALGTDASESIAYPNLQSYLSNELFQYHIENMENTPIIWKFTTEKLVSDPKRKGFECFIDYHQLDASIFDRLTNNYLEPRKAELRERRSTAKRRRDSDTLDASEQAEAAEAFERYTSQLEQISIFEEALQDLSDTTEREFNEEYQDLARHLAPKVEEFRKETKERLVALENLHDLKDEDWFKENFSPKFWETVEKRRNEWLDALDDLKYACEEYAKPADMPIEAHLADLFDYYNEQLKGSDHYSSTGILFMTYYFEREGEKYLDKRGEPKDTLTDESAEYLATMAAGLDEYKELADEIEEGCEALRSAIPSDWSSRALSEITVPGYQPKNEHGVEINITPIAEAEIVPKIVEDKVL